MTENRALELEVRKLQHRNEQPARIHSLSGIVHEHGQHDPQPNGNAENLTLLRSLCSERALSPDKLHLHSGQQDFPFSQQQTEIAQLRNIVFRSRDNERSLLAKITSLEKELHSHREEVSHTGADVPQFSPQLPRVHNESRCHSAASAVNPFRVTAQRPFHPPVRAEGNADSARAAPRRECTEFLPPPAGPHSCLDLRSLCRDLQDGVARLGNSDSHSKNSSARGELEHAVLNSLTGATEEDCDSDASLQDLPIFGTLDRGGEGRASSGVAIPKLDLPRVFNYK